MAKVNWWLINAHPEMNWGVCMECKREMNPYVSGYCDECIEERHGPMPDRVGCADCLGDGCAECGGTGKVERPKNPPKGERR